MKIEELTTYQKYRFNLNRLCCKCHRYIFDQDDFEYSVKSIGRRTFYNFYHKECINNVEVEQETKKAYGWWKH